MIITFCFLYKKDAEVPTGITNLLEIFIIFIRDQIVKPAVGEGDYRQMTPLFCTYFFFILFLNLMGMIPLFVTATGNLNVTAGLAAITLSLMILGSIYKNNFFGFLKSFVPSGVPVFILPIIIPVEFLSMFIRSFALMVRLCANMVAGHIVILSLIGLIFVAGAKALPAMVLIIFMYFLEIMIAFLQAYIFTLFSAIFIGLMMHPEH